MITGIIIAAVLVGGTGLIIGLLLGVAGKKFAVEVNEKEGSQSRRGQEYGAGGGEGAAGPDRVHPRRLLSRGHEEEISHVF